MRWPGELLDQTLSERIRFVVTAIELIEFARVTIGTDERMDRLLAEYERELETLQTQPNNIN